MQLLRPEGPRKRPGDGGEVAVAALHMTAAVGSAVAVRSTVGAERDPALPLNRTRGGAVVLFDGLSFISKTSSFLSAVWGICRSIRVLEVPSYEADVCCFLEPAVSLN